MGNITGYASAHVNFWNLREWLPQKLFKEAEHLVFMRGKGGAVFLGIPSDKDRYLYTALALLLRSQPKQFFIFSGFPAVEQTISTKGLDPL